MSQPTESLPYPANTSAEEYIKALLDAQGIIYTLVEPYRGGMIETPERWRMSAPLTVSVYQLLPIKSSLGQATENELNRHMKAHGCDAPITLRSIYLSSWVEFELPLA